MQRAEALKRWRAAWTSGARMSAPSARRVSPVGTPFAGRGGLRGLPDAAGALRGRSGVSRATGGDGVPGRCAPGEARETRLAGFPEGVTIDARGRELGAPVCGSLPS